MELSPFWGLEDAIKNLLGITQPVAEQVPGIQALGQIDPAYLTSLGGGFGLTGAAGTLPMKERLASLMESPSYFETPLRDRLALIKGQAPARPPQLQELLQRYASRGAPNTSARLAQIAGKKPPEPTLYPDGWVSKLIKR